VNVRRLEREKSEREKNGRRRRSVRVDVDLVAMSNSSEAISYRDQWIDLNRPALRIMATHEVERWTVKD